VSTDDAIRVAVMVASDAGWLSPVRSTTPHKRCGSTWSPSLRASWRLAGLHAPETSSRLARSLNVCDEGKLDGDGAAHGRPGFARLIESDKPPAPYPVAWARVQRAQRRVAIGCIAFVVGVLFVCGSAPRHSPVRWLLLVPAIFGAGIIVAYLGTIRCPHCGERIMWRGPLDRQGPESARLRDGKCSHCGTQIGPRKGGASFEHP
jgi:predicted RNA-binding Zn-ribbon protein involved in translation (DUF1610 family)